MIQTENPKLINHKYKILEKISEGHFGEIYKAVNVRTTEEVAIKIEPILNETQLLKNETKIYQYLKIKNVTGIPDIKWFGVDEINNYMVMTLLGLSLTDLKHKYKKISLSVILQIGKQILSRLKYVHEMGLIHRDVKPDNFVFGTGKNSALLYIIDFGLCKKYKTPLGKHIEHKKIGNIIGTPKFASLNITENLDEPSRRDDLESMVYILLYLISEKEKEKEKDFDKTNTEPFSNILEYIRNLKFE
jgi:serine/threonine protein kinase